MQLENLFEEFDKLQLKYGDKSLDAIYGAGKIENPDICLVFMNPTAKNVGATKNRKGLKAPWLGTKNIRRMLASLGLFSTELSNIVQQMSLSDRNEEFSNIVYKDITNRSIYITNLSKATQVDARPLHNDVFKKYLYLFEKEISLINPKKIITFGNQVSSIVLDQNIKVGEWRKKSTEKEINGSMYTVYPVFYPVGQGMRNIQIAKEDIAWIVSN